MNPLVTLTVQDESQSKANYLRWRTQWRNNYVEVSHLIRNFRKTYRDRQRNQSWEESMRVLGALEANQRIARRMMREHTKGKKLVREYLRAKGLSAPDPKKRPAPEPREKKRLTAAEIDALRSAARHKQTMASADAHSD